MEMDTFGITFTPEKLKRFKAEYATCKDEQSTFDFEGKNWLAGYALYLIRFLEATFEGMRMAGKPTDRMKYKGTSDDYNLNSK